MRRLDSSLKVYSTLDEKYQSLTTQAQDYRIQVEKIPGLLAEIARLRGTSRASLRALSEQDKNIANIRTQMKQLERENTRLKADSRNTVDLEAKLKEANNEITRLMMV